jgi:hypothetical protein
MPLPYLFVAVAINGGHFGSALFPVGMQLPINILIVDAKGEAVRVLITPKGATFLT